MRPSLRAAIALGALASSALAVAVVTRNGGDAHATEPPPLAAPPVARLGVMYGPVDGDTTEVGVATLGPSATPARVRTIGTVTHPPGSARRGAIVPGHAPGSEVAVIAVAEPGDRRSSYANALFRVDVLGVTRLCGGVAIAATPMVTASGHVLVARGVDGPEPSAADAKRLLLREDELTIDDVDVATGAIVTLWRGTGYQAFLGATISTSKSQEVAVYLSTRGGSSILALDPATHGTRVLASSIAPWARDFSWDSTHRSLVFVDLVAPFARSYEVVSLDPATAATRSLFVTTNAHSMPFALPGGELAISSDNDVGLALLSTTTGTLRTLAPLGAGSDAVTHASSDGRWIAMRHTSAAATNGPPITVGVDVATGIAEPLALPGDLEVQAIGFEVTP